MNSRNIYMDILKRKLTNIPNKQKIKQQREQGVIVWYVCIKV